MSKKKLIYQLVSLIPKGKVLTYKIISDFLGINSARLVGQILHQNKNPKKIPCHRVIFSDGALSKNYAFGGKEKQKEKLEKEGVKFYFLSDRFKDRKVDLEKSLWQPTKVLKLYFFLLKKYGDPGPWPWFNQGKKASIDEIIVGAVLTQNTNWNNVEKALDNLRKNKLNKIEKIYWLGKKNLIKLKQLIRPSGFYNQKGEYLFNLSSFLIEKYQGYKNFFKLSLKKARQYLLNIKGIGEETADTILLYAADKPVFVVDRYTIFFARKYFKNVTFLSDRSKMLQQNLQKFFMNNLPLNIKLFQDYHALIVRWGKEN